MANSARTSREFSYAAYFSEIDADVAALWKEIQQSHLWKHIASDDQTTLKAMYENITGDALKNHITMLQETAKSHDHFAITKSIKRDIASHMIAFEKPIPESLSEATIKHINTMLESLTTSYVVKNFVSTLSTAAFNGYLQSRPLEEGLCDIHEECDGLMDVIDKERSGLTLKFRTELQAIDETHIKITTLSPKSKLFLLGLDTTNDPTLADPIIDKTIGAAIHALKSASIEMLKNNSDCTPFINPDDTAMISLTRTAQDLFLK